MSDRSAAGSCASPLGDSPTASHGLSALECFLLGAVHGRQEQAVGNESSERCGGRKVGAGIAARLEQDSGDRAHRGRQDKQGTVSSPEPPLPLVFSRVFDTLGAQLPDWHI